MATEVLVPPLGQTVDTVTLVSWYKNEGDMVDKGEMLFAIETDKATLDIEAPESGVLGHVTAEPGQEVMVLSRIALIIPKDQLPTAVPPVNETSPTAVFQRPLQRQDRDSQPSGLHAKIFISPRARKLAEKHHVSLDLLRPTGPEGAIVERDVQAYLDAKRTPSITPVARRLAEATGADWQAMDGSGPSGRIMRSDINGALHPAAEDNDILESIRVEGVQSLIARRMYQSAITTAPVTLNSEVNATNLVALRHNLRQDGVEVSYNSLMLAILSRALREHPRINASLTGDTITVWKRIDIGLAVDTDRGLLVPVIRDVDTKSLGHLSVQVPQVTLRARAGQCRPDELQGGTFTLTNLGMFGIDSFTPIINLPECAILGMGRIKTVTAWSEQGPVPQQTMWLSLTFDHRLVDGAPAARFLQRVAQLVERPHLLLT